MPSSDLLKFDKNRSVQGLDIVSSNALPFPLELLALHIFSVAQNVEHFPVRG